MPGKPWGTILVGTRLGKLVDPTFFMRWTMLVMRGLRKGDGVCPVKDRVAHVAANDIVRFFLKTSHDTLFLLDSDADIDPGFLDRFRDFEPGWEYDALQAFYTTRHWPPRAVWFETSPLGDTIQGMVTEDGVTQDVPLVGAHALLVRREVFEAMLDASPGVPEKEFDWFYYPRHRKGTEDTGFSMDARALGFRLGATTAIKAGHVGQMIYGWDTYQEYLDLSGTRARNAEFKRLCRLVGEYTGEEPEIVEAKALRGSHNVRQAWEARRPASADEVRAFYDDAGNGYLYDLCLWNTSDGYQELLAPLKHVRGARALVVGAGIGGEIEALKARNEVDYFEPGEALNDFLHHRFRRDHDRVFCLHANRLDELADKRAGKYDLIVAIDVIEHVHPSEIDSFLEAVGCMLGPEGVLYAHNNFGEQDKYPMHYDHSGKFAAWLALAGLEKEGEYVYRKISMSERLPA